MTISIMANYFSSSMNIVITSQKDLDFAEPYLLRNQNLVQLEISNCDIDATFIHQVVKRSNITIYDCYLISYDDSVFISTCDIESYSIFGSYNLVIQVDEYDISKIVDILQVKSVTVEYDINQTHVYPPQDDPSDKLLFKLSNLDLDRIVFNHCAINISNILNFSSKSITFNQCHICHCNLDDYNPEKVTRSVITDLTIFESEIFIPTEINKLTTLKTLTIVKSKVTGFHNLNLSRINIINVTQSRLHFIRDLTLYCSELNLIKTLILHIDNFNLPNCKSIILSRNYIKTIKRFNIPKCEYLDLTSNHLTSFFCDDKIKHLKLGNNLITSLPSNLGVGTESGQSTGGLGVSIGQGLRTGPSLEILEIYNNKLTSIEELRNVKFMVKVGKSKLIDKVSEYILNNKNINLDRDVDNYTHVVYDNNEAKSIIILLILTRNYVEHFLNLVPNEIFEHIMNYITVIYYINTHYIKSETSDD